MREIFFSLIGFKSYLVTRDQSLVTRFFVMRLWQRFKTKETRLKTEGRRRKTEDGLQKTEGGRQRTAICDTHQREHKFTIVDFISNSGKRIAHCVCCQMDPANGDFWFDFQSYK